MNARPGWYCQFLEEDLKTPLRRKLTFQNPDKVRELIERGGADSTSAAKQTVEYAITMGRGGVWLNLTEEQYRRLK